jgi:hypothetical protein
MAREPRFDFGAFVEEVVADRAKLVERLLR